MKILSRAPAVLVVSIVAVLVGTGDARDVSAAFSAESEVTISTKATNGIADTTITTTLPSGDYNFSLIAWGTPSQATVAYGPGHTNQPALGDVVGTLSTTASYFGFSDTPCAANVTLSFTFLNASVDINDTIDTVPQAFANNGDGGTLANQWTDNGASPLADSPWNAAWSGLTSAEQTNGLPAQVDDYPSYLKKLFTPDGGAPIQPYGGTPVQPRARYAAAAKVAGTVFTLNLVVFDPDALATAFAPPHPFADLKGLGYTTVVVLNDPTQTGSQVSVTDFCTPITSTTTLYGTAKTNSCSGTTTSPCNTPEGINSPQVGANTNPRYKNPGTGGTYFWTAFHQSLRNSDGDTKENQLDPCPTTADSFDPRLVGGDITNDDDLDGIPDVCDTSPLNVGDHDQDNDGWSNALDNCPRVSNPTQVETEATSVYATAANRGGPRTDGIGDACDSESSGSGTVASGVFDTTLTIATQCIGGTDSDFDGWCAGGGSGIPADPNDLAPRITPEDYDLAFPMAIAHSGSGATPPMRQPAQVCNDGIDNDLDGLTDVLDSASGNSTCRPKNVVSHPGYPACPSAGCAGIDTDGDGWTDEAEVSIGTDALGRCNVSATPFVSNDWPADFNSTSVPNSIDKVTLMDLTSFLGPVYRLNKTPDEPEFDLRWDLVPGPTIGSNWIQLNDLTSLLGGPTGFPPMFSGTKAFGGSGCTMHPIYGD